MTEEEKRLWDFHTPTWTTDTTNDFLIAKIELQNRDEQRMIDEADITIHMVFKVRYSYYNNGSYDCSRNGKSDGVDFGVSRLLRSIQGPNR